MERSVWVFDQAQVWIFAENSSGVYGANLLQYCYFTGVSLSASTPVVRRAVTGRNRRKLLNLASSFEDVNMQVDHMLYRAALEYDKTNIFNAEKQLRIVLQMYELTYTNAAPFENDQFELSFAKATQFSISGQSGDEVTAKANFEAEILLADADNNRVPASLLV